MLSKYIGNCSLFAQSVHKTTWLVVFSIFFISGCSDEKITVQAEQLCALAEPIDENAASAIAFAKPCSFSTALGDIELRSSEPSMPVEQPIAIHLRTPSETYILHSEITGVSMYMGRIPVIWEPIGNDVWETTIYLGACTDPNMLWQLEVGIGKTNEPGNKTTVKIPFQSTW
ncbi:hypothetical protein CWE13_01520 [Aliidiomarina shirensis]|uniref:Lipoprotein n=1 Tax=Aliidiomarina shirensis TaxID=1048642 RepID=A0A432WX34_9GAMM|nr:hypothetical protein CWE13_01520 [Aliidiomarina shirensis]